MRFASLFITLAVSPAIFAQQPPSGLWLGNEQGVVVKIEPCGNGFCGYGAGVLAGKGKDPKKICGKEMWKDFIWNEKSSRWEGSAFRPGSDTAIKAYITTSGSTSLTLTAKVMLLSKTMNFVPFTGSIGESCEVKN